VSILGFFIRSGIQFGASMLKAKLDSFEASLKILERAAVSEEGQTVSQSKQLDTIKLVYGDLQKHSDKCLMYHTELTNAMNDLKEIRSDISSFVEDGKEARKLTQDTVTRLGDRLDTFMIKLLEITKNLTELGLRRGN
jgi:multidrug resistance efflux pump